MATERIGLILPASLCAGQVARIAAERLNSRLSTIDQPGFSRISALVHTEGCGFGGDDLYQLLVRTMCGYLVHPNTACGLVLEHGCEKTHADLLRREFEEHGIRPEQFGWASIQLDGGMDQVLNKIDHWFDSQLVSFPALERVETPLRSLSIGILSSGSPHPVGAQAAAILAQAVLAGGGSILIPCSDPLWNWEDFRRLLRSRTPTLEPSLSYGQFEFQAGLHAMESPSPHWMENLTGLAGCGVHLVLGLMERPQAGHEFVRVLQAGASTSPAASDLDLVFHPNPAMTAARMASSLAALASGEILPQANAARQADFQLTRGVLGVSS